MAKRAAAEGVARGEGASGQRRRRVCLASVDACRTQPIWAKGGPLPIARAQKPMHRVGVGQVHDDAPQAPGQTHGAMWRRWVQRFRWKKVGTSTMMGCTAECTADRSKMRADTRWHASRRPGLAWRAAATRQRWTCVNSWQTTGPTPLVCGVSWLHGTCRDCGPHCWLDWKRTLAQPRRATHKANASFESAPWLHPVGR